MKSVSTIINDINTGMYDVRLSELYVSSHIDKQKERYIKLLEKFMNLYGDLDVMVFSTPGRSEVSGNHTDHQRGEVLAASINLDMIAVASQDDIVKVISDEYDLKPIDPSDLDIKEEEKGTSEGLIRGVLAGLKQEGIEIRGFKALITSDVLQGSGLSSSAAFEDMIGLIETRLYGEDVDPVTIAKIGQYSENNYFGKPCGLMDQCACSVGGLIHIDFKDDPVVERVDVDFSAFHSSLCIVDVHASHADLTEDYAAIPREMKAVANVFGKEVLRDVDEETFYARLNDVREAVNDRAVLRAIHFFDEDKRVKAAVKALNHQDYLTFKKVIRSSGDSSYRFLQNIYAPTDASHQAVAIALALSERCLGKHGVCRVHGGGFAGTIQAFVDDDFVETYKAMIETYFGEGSCHVLKIRPMGISVVIE